MLFFGFWVHGETLAGRMGGGTQGPALHSPIKHRRRAGVYSRRKICYNTPTKERASYGKGFVRLPWQDFPEFRKVLVPLRKIAFLN